MVNTWKECIRSLSGMAVWSVLKFKVSNSTEVRVTILKEPLTSQPTDIHAEIPTDPYTTRQKYLFYSYCSEKEGITNIAIYEKTMANVNGGKSMSISDNFGKIKDSDTIECYKNSIVEFILANIVWK